MRRHLLTLTVAITVAACGLVPVQEGPPVPAGPLGPIVPGANGGPPIECRGVPLAPCKDLAGGQDADAVRYIVTCTSVCTPDKGDVRIDILAANGATRPAGNGSYETAQAAPDPIVTPPPSDPGPS